MSRHFAAYFAIVGTLVFALPGAASAGPHFNFQQGAASAGPHFNFQRGAASAGPHFNFQRLQMSVPTPRLSSPKLTTPSLGSGPKVTMTTTKSKKNKPRIEERQIPSLGGGGTDSPPGSASAMPVSNTGGGSLSANPGGGPPTSRFRVIEVTRGRFAVVEGRSENIVAAGFENSKAAWAWIANHV
jgi:hypothetical protein